MKVAGDGLPEIGRSARQLGVRTPNDVGPGVQPDVLVQNPADVLTPGMGGMSVAPLSPVNLPPLRRPPEYAGGRGKDPVWEIDTDELISAGVQFRQDSPKHGLLEPAVDMPLSKFEESLGKTREKWKLVSRPIEESK